MYRIMIEKTHKDNFESLYQYMTTTIDGRTSPVELSTKAELDAKIEDMLNNEGYAKSDFIVVQVVDYKIDATDYQGCAEE